MSESHEQWFLSGDEVYDQDRSDAQIYGLLDWLGEVPKQVIDQGCGVGRALVPLASAGHEVLGVDHDQQSVDSCCSLLQSKGIKARVICADFHQSLPNETGRADAIICLGNTFMLLVDPLEAADLLGRWRAQLKPGGAVIIDDIPQDLLSELTEGRWQDGVSEDGQLQLAWAHGDLVFAIRTGEAVNEEEPGVLPGEPCFRLWTMGALELVASQAGFERPQWLSNAGLLVFKAI